MPETATKVSNLISPFTIKSMLVPLLTRPRVAQFVKWSVYTLLTINFFFYFYDDFTVYKAAVANDAPWSEFFVSFATTIDVVGWLGLVYIFELETYILSEEAFEGALPWILRMLRMLCYLLIFYAAYGYTENTLDNYRTIEVAGLTDLCQVADQGQSLQLNVIDFVEITSGNCSNISAGPPFYRIDINVSLIDAPTLDHVQKLGWPDVSNALAWLVVVFLIELEVWLQGTDRFGSRALKLTRQVKTGFYLVLLLNVVIWAVTGYALWAYDALLWIVGFWAIELNLAEWEQERVQELSTAG